MRFHSGDLNVGELEQAYGFVPTEGHKQLKT